MRDLAHASIGIFDSGIGGLTVAKAVAMRLPHENILYFGDTAHAPYGDKSALTIRQYCYGIVDFLISKQCKVILVACNSAAAAAFPDLKAYVAKRALLLGVIDPLIAHIAQHYHDKTIGLIGTKQTVASRVFEQKILSLPNKLKFKALATSLLVPLIEENFHHQKGLVEQVLNVYLKEPSLADIDALILGCTHYPVIKEEISAYYQHKLPLVEAGELTANALADMLVDHPLLNPQTVLGQHQFFVSDYTEAFAAMAKRFFGSEIKLETCAFAVS